jgi:hypothetical protein
MQSTMNLCSCLHLRLEPAVVSKVVMADEVVVIVPMVLFALLVADIV